MQAWCGAPAQAELCLECGLQRREGLVKPCVVQEKQKDQKLQGESFYCSVSAKEAGVARTRQVNADCIYTIPKGDPGGIPMETMITLWELASPHSILISKAACHPSMSRDTNDTDARFSQHQ